jgi:tRNA(Arg) A34 adenosine deaminase TadA
LCLSAITWTGFENFWFLFSHEDSRDSFAIPHDLKILKEVFTLDPGGYNAKNAFWESHALMREIATLGEGDRNALEAQVTRIAKRYAALSVIYQDGKGGNAIPFN